MAADPERRARARETVAGIAQYGLLFGFAAVAAAISAQGLTGFAQVNMGLTGPWPYLLWGALDGAAGLCAVLLMRRAARGESALAPRLAVWGLVAASAMFNWAHAPAHPGARPAFALMPVIAAVLFEFSLRETRHVARRADRRLASMGWLRPAERVKVRLRLAADESLSASGAARLVRVDAAARRLYLLGRATGSYHGPAIFRIMPGFNARRAERRAQAALTRARFADPAAAAEILRQVQVLALTRTLAGLDYSTPDAARLVLASLITPGPPPGRTGSVPPVLVGPAVLPDRARPRFQPSRNPDQECPDPGLGTGNGDGAVAAAAARMVGQARADGIRLSQAALARQLRADGHRIANGRLRWLAAASGLQPDRGQEQS